MSSHTKGYLCKCGHQNDFGYWVHVYTPHSHACVNCGRVNSFQYGIALFGNLPNTARTGLAGTVAENSEGNQPASR